MAFVGRKLHIFFFPLMAKGHMIPMIDIARLFAAQDTKATIVTTPLNALHFSESIARDKQSGHDIDVITIPFPAVEAGLPERCEDTNCISSMEMVGNFFKAVSMLHQPFDKLVGEHRPDCIIADMFLPWATDVADKYELPRLVFHGTSCFSMCLMESLHCYAPHKKVKLDSEVFVVPGLPDKVQMTRLQLPALDEDVFFSTADKMQEAEKKSFGTIVNSFYELEPAYTEFLREIMGRRSWIVGPVSLRNSEFIDKAQRGRKPSNDEQSCISWLDSKEPNSVLYVSFGSATQFSNVQLAEIGMGLEASKVPFIWVVKKPQDAERVDFLPEGFEGRVEGKGLIIIDWAPQLLILDHPAVGGFMTHCGWNSILEGISAGLPFITWPVYAEQFNNEKLITQVLKIGISAGNQVWSSSMEPQDLLPKDTIKEVVTQLMNDGKEAKDRRGRSRELGVMAKTAVEKDGSSYNDLKALIGELREKQRRRK